MIKVGSLRPGDDYGIARSNDVSSSPPDAKPAHWSATGRYPDFATSPSRFDADSAWPDISVATGTSSSSV